MRVRVRVAVQTHKQAVVCVFHTPTHQVTSYLVLTLFLPLRRQNFDFHPVSFILPQDWPHLNELLLREDETHSKWIAKPVFGGQVTSVTFCAHIIWALLLQYHCVYFPRGSLLPVMALSHSLTPPLSSLSLTFYRVQGVGIMMLNTSELLRKHPEIGDGKYLVQRCASQLLVSFFLSISPFLSLSLSLRSPPLLHTQL